MIRMNIDLESYLHEMEDELNSFQQLMTETFSKIKQEEYSTWYGDNNEVMKKYGSLLYSIEFNNENDTKNAQTATWEKYKETMNVFLKARFGVVYN